MVALPEDRAKSAEEIAREAAEAEIAKRPPANHEDGQEEVESGKPAAEAAAGDDEKPGAPPFAEDPRLSMADRFTKERARKKAEEAGKEPVAVIPTKAKPAEEEAEGDNGLDVEAKEQPEKPASEAKPAPADEDPIVEITVNGRKVQLPLSEVKATAAKNLAADDYLRQAKEIIGAAKKSAKAPAVENHDGEETEAKSGTEPVRQNRVDKAKLVTIAETIQTGSPEEGAEVLAELLTALPSREEVRQEAEATVLQHDARTEANRALSQLATEYPDLANDRRLASLVIGETVDGMVRALEEAGAPEEHIAQIRGNPEWVRDYYREARALPELSKKLRSPIDVARAAAKQINDEFVVPRKQQPKPEPGQRAGRIEVSPERETRKADLPRQPRSASLRSAPGSQAQRSVQDKRRDAFSEVAARR